METSQNTDGLIPKYEANQKVGRLLLTEFIAVISNTGVRRSGWMTTCECGRVLPVRQSQLLYQGLANCRKCDNRRFFPYGKKVHQMPEYTSWRGMIERCKSNRRYRHVKVCKRWTNFRYFYEDMGPRPNGMSIDRIDCHLGYEPLNCRWADAKTQARNKRCSLAQSEVADIKRLLAVGFTSREVSTILSIKQGKIAEIKSGRSWND